MVNVIVSHSSPLLKPDRAAVVIRPLSPSKDDAESAVHSSCSQRISDRVPALNPADVAADKHDIVTSLREHHHGVDPPAAATRYLRDGDQGCSFSAEQARGQAMKPAFIDHIAPVLIVEDDLLIAWSIEQIARDMGFDNVIVASTGESALQAVGSTKFGLIICDLNLGPLTVDGIQLLTLVDPDEIIPTLIYTAYRGRKIETALTSARPKAFRLLKPASEVQFTSMILTLLGDAERTARSLDGMGVS